MSRRGPLRRLWKRFREEALDRAGLLYSSRFYAKSDRHKGESDAVVAETLIARYRPARVVDLGCGNGAFLAAFARHGVDVLGLERSGAGLALCAERGVPAVPFDLRHDGPPPSAEADLALCFEVAEHIEAAHAGRLVALLCDLAPRIAFTAAPPGQGGVHHVNEQPPGYWLSRFADHGYHLDEAATAELRQAWRNAGVVVWLVANLMILERTCEPSSSTATEC